ncbi:hypothetical protein [Kocuria aegyptia]|uniref:Uncharacterized protein n=1 Tax=Kocuria aegyptia TaxID=330943 RepID=A0ABN2L6G8_9MICC
MTEQQHTRDESEPDELTQAIAGILMRRTPEDALGIVTEAFDRALAAVTAESDSGPQSLTEQDRADIAAIIRPPHN